MRLVDERRPEAIDVRFRGADVGRIRPSPRSERLRGIHLQRALVTELAPRLLAAMNAAGLVGVEQAGGAVVTTRVPREAIAL